MAPEIGSHSLVEVARSREPSLRQEAFYLRENWRREGLPENWYYLDHTGFHVRKQIDMLYNDLSDAHYASYRDVVDNWLRKTGEDLHGFVLEYLTKRCVFPIRYKIEDVAGSPRVVASSYGNVLMVDTVSERERNGVVKKTLVEDVEPRLLAACDGDLIVITSKDGPSGMYDFEGRQIVYQDSQTYILQKQGKNIVGFTIRTDLTSSEHREVIERLGGGKMAEDASDEEYYANVVFLPQRSYQDGFEEVVRTIQSVRQSPYAYKNRFWSEIYADLAKRERLWQYDEATKTVLNEFSHIVLNEVMSQRELEELLATAILRLSRKVLGEVLQSRFDGTTMSFQQSFADIDGVGDLRFFSYGLLLSDVENLAGCNGGGGNSPFRSLYQALMLTVTPRIITLSAQQAFGNEGVCVHCQKSLRDNHYHCPSCKKEYESELALTPDERTERCDCGQRFSCR